MFQHSPNIRLESCGDVAWDNVPASRSNLTMNINTLGIRVGESVLYYYATNAATGSVTVSHTGLTPVNGISYQPVAGGVMQGFAVVHYPLGLLPNTQITFSKANFWGTTAVMQAIRLTNGFGLQSHGAVTISNYVTPNTTGFTFGTTAGTQVKPGYKKSMATIVSSVCATNSALTAIAPGWTNFGIRNVAQMSFSLNGRAQAIFPTGNESFLATYAANIPTLHFMAVRISN